MSKDREENNRKMIIKTASEKRKVLLFVSRLTLSLIFVFSLILQPISAFATINKQINYQGKLVDSSGIAVSDGNYQIEFNLYTASSGGSPVWTENRTGANEVAVSGGLFNVMLGSVSSLASIDFNQTLYLGVKVESDSEMSPRKILGAVPASFESDKLDGQDGSYYLNANNLNNFGSPFYTYFHSTTTDALTEGVSNLYYTNTRNQNYLDTLDKGYFYSTTSADHWLTTKNLTAFSTTSADYWKTQNDFFSTTSAAYWKSVTDLFSTTSANYLISQKTTDNLAQGSTNKYYDNNLVNSYIHSSSTIAKLYTANTFTGANIFNGGLTIGSLSGPLQAINGSVSASSTIGVAYGGTGSNSFSSGGFLFGNGVGALSASSSPTVGWITATSTTATSTFAGVLNAGGLNGFTVLQNGKVGIGTTSTSNILNVNYSGVGSPDSSQFKISNSTSGGSITALAYSSGNASLGFGLEYIDNSWKATESSGFWLYKDNGIFTIDSFSGADVGSNVGRNRIISMNSTNGAVDISNSLGIGAYYTAGGIGVPPAAGLGVDSGILIGGGSSGYINIYDSSGGNQSVNITSDGLSYFNGGNVGIGTNSPSAKLSIIGLENTDGNSESPDILYAGGGNGAAFSTAKGSKIRMYTGNGGSGGAGLDGAIAGDFVVTTGDGGSGNPDGNDYGYGGKGGNIVFSTGNGGSVLAGASIGSYGGNAGDFIINLGNGGYAGAGSGPVNGRAGFMAVGTSSPSARFTLWGSDVGTNKLAEFVDSASTTRFSILENGTTYFSGNVGIGTTSPYAKLSVVGQVVGEYFTATSTTASSTFGNGINLTGGCFAVNGICVGGGTSNYTNTDANAYIHSSSTIAKAYTANTFTAANIFNGGLTIGSLSGPLQAINGVISASSTLSVAYGGTGLSSLPSYGNILVGNALGNYSLVSTSTLGIALSDTTGTLPVLRGGTGQTSFSQGWLGINDSGAFISSTSPTMNYIVATSTTATSTFRGGVVGANNFVIQQSSGRVGIGTSSPALPLDIAYSNNTFGFGVNVTNTNTGNNALIGYGINNSSGTRVGQYIYVPSNYTSTGLQNTLMLSSVGNVKLGFVASADGGSNPDIYFQSGTTKVINIDGITKNVGIGTTSPYAKLSVVGQVVGEYFTATSTTASSTFGNGINLTGGCFAINGSCITAGGGSSPWQTSGSNIYYANGNVGIGTNNPTRGLLDVYKVNEITIPDIAFGDINFDYENGAYSANGDTFTFNVHAYRTINGTRLYSPNPLVLSRAINNTETVARIVLTWDVVADAEGYRVVVVGDLQYGANNDYYFDTPNNYAHIGTDVIGVDSGSGHGYSYGTLNGGVFSLNVGPDIYTDNTTGKTFFGGDMSIAGSITSSLRIDPSNYLDNYFTFTDEGNPTFRMFMPDGREIFNLQDGSNGSGDAYMRLAQNSTGDAFVLAGNGLLDGNSNAPIVGWNGYMANLMNSMYIPYQDGDIGVGVSTPKARFHIAGRNGWSGGNIFKITGGTSMFEDFWGGYDGDNIIMGAGNGGGGTAVVDLSGGAGGTISITSGNGGNVEETPADPQLYTIVGGVGGNLNLTAGNGGSAKYALSATGGKGGNVVITAGNGGLTDITNGTQFAISGNGGDVILSGGRKGSDDGSVDGNIILSPYYGQVGIGTTTPWAQFSIAAFSNSTTPIFTISTSTASATSTAFMIDNKGKVGIATTSPWKTLSVNGTVAFNGLTGGTGAGSICLSANKELIYNSGTDACLPSLRSTKNNINDLSLDGLSIINQLKPVSFIYNESDGRIRYGFIAEDTASVNPQLATYNDKLELSGIDDRAIISVLTKAVQELDIKVSGFGSTTMSIGTTTSLTANIIQALDDLGARITNGIAEFKDLIVEKITVKNIKVKADDISKTGITIYDRVTGEPVCMFIANGVMQNEAGECGAISLPANISNPTVIDDNTVTDNISTSTESVESVDNTSPVNNDISTTTSENIQETVIEPEIIPIVENVQNPADLTTDNTSLNIATSTE